MRKLKIIGIAGSPRKGKINNIMDSTKQKDI